MTNKEVLIDSIGIWGFNSLTIAICVFFGAFFIYGITHNSNMK